MELEQETLAGRTAILHMPSLSQHEIYGSGENHPFTPDLDFLKSRKTTGKPADINGIYDRIWYGSMPGLISGNFTDRDVFYSSYVRTYIGRDVGEIVDRIDKSLFQGFVRAADIDISDDTAKHWLAVLEKFFIYVLIKIICSTIQSKP